MALSQAGSAATLRVPDRTTVSLTLLRWWRQTGRLLGSAADTAGRTASHETLQRDRRVCDRCTTIEFSPGIRGGWLELQASDDSVGLGGRGPQDRQDLADRLVVQRGLRVVLSTFPKPVAVDGIHHADVALMHSSGPERLVGVKNRELVNPSEAAHVGLDIIVINPDYWPDTINLTAAECESRARSDVPQQCCGMSLLTI